MKLEARQVAILRHPETGVLVGKLYVWENGDADPLWSNNEVAGAIAVPLPGENLDWADWTRSGSTKPPK